MKHTKSLADQVRYYKTKCCQLKSQLHRIECTDCNKLDIAVEELKEEKRELLEKNAELRDEIKKKNKVDFYSEGKYADNLRLCIMELLSYNVAELKIEPVIRSVLKQLSIECDKLPKRTTINEILIESRALAKTQLTDALTSNSNNTLHSDGTTKFGHKYQSYQVATDAGSLTLGLEVRATYTIAIIPTSSKLIVSTMKRLHTTTHFTHPQHSLHPPTPGADPGGARHVSFEPPFLT